jgi:cytochrome c oxidase subunit II
MNTEFSLFPDQASTFAGRVDALYFFILGVTLFFAVLVALLLVYFAIRYRRRSEHYIPPRILGAHRFEAMCIGFLFLLFMVIFAWGSSTYFSMVRPPDDAMEVYVVGKQWMWKVQHPNGVRELNQLHIPVNQPVKLLMTSEDVIHDVWVPAFRVKQDVLPGRYTVLWFQATKTGRYHLNCAQYCGTEHSTMVGWVEVMEQADYDAWLAKKGDLSMGERGRQLFLKHQCITCHNREQQRAPLLENLYGKRVTLQDGSTVLFDEAYITESIRDPKAKIVAGYRPIMPPFPPKRLDEQELQDLIEFLKNLKEGQTPTRNEQTPPPENAPEGP